MPSNLNLTCRLTKITTRVAIFHNSEWLQSQHYSSQEAMAMLLAMASVAMLLAMASAWMPLGYANANQSNPSHSKSAHSCHRWSCRRRCSNICPMLSDSRECKYQRFPVPHATSNETNLLHDKSAHSSHR